MFKFKNKVLLLATMMAFSIGYVPQEAHAKNRNDHTIGDVVERIGDVISFGFELHKIPLAIASIPAAIVCVAIYGLPEKNAMKRKKQYQSNLIRSRLSYTYKVPVKTSGHSWGSRAYGN